MTPNHDPRPRVDLDGRWHKSSYSTAACTCVEVRLRGAAVQIRDSKAVLDPDSHPETPPIIELTVPDWERLCRRIVDRRPVLAAGSVSVRLSANGTARFRCSRSGVELSFSADEMAAFVAGVLTGEFRQRQLAA